MDITAQDLWPLVLKLSREERVRLARLALAAPAPGGPSERAAYEAAPVLPDEFGGEENDPLAWEAEGWEDVP